MAEEKNNFINESGKAGLVIGGVAIAYFIIGLLLSKAQLGFFGSLLSFLLWAGKFVLCIWLMHNYIKAYATGHGCDRSHAFRFGMNVALCSALLYSGAYLFYVLVINPEFFSTTFQTLAETYSNIMTSDQIDRILNMESSMPTASFFVNLIWCWLFGTIVSAISSRKICGEDNPFADEK